MRYRVLIEASGSLTSNYLIKAVKDAGEFVISSDIDECAASFNSNQFVIVPSKNDPDLWLKLENIIVENKINVVIPSFDETLLGWAERKSYFLTKGVHVIISDQKVLEICQDKWNTYNFFKELGIPTPETSKSNLFPVIKPRIGRGGKGISINKIVNSMEGMISQELLTGTEYTIDIFCDKNSYPTYIVPRVRLKVVDGKSIDGITRDSPKIVEYVKIICNKLKFIGPINMQCFEDINGEIKFIEINPRVGGGMALGFQATENWVKLIFTNLIEGKLLNAVDVVFDLKMYRFYNELFTK